MPSWITVHIFRFPTEAYTAKAKLESCGIDVFLKDELITQLKGSNSIHSNGVQLQVEEIFAEDARKILIEGGYLHNRGNPKRKIEVLDKDAFPDKTRCPYCQSENIDTIVHPNIFVVFFYFILGVIFPLFRSWEKCYDCNKEWKYKKRKK